jgi:hypothetical protein
MGGNFNKDPSVSWMRISFMILFILEKLSILGYFVELGATTLIYVSDLILLLCLYLALVTILIVSG